MDIGRLLVLAAVTAAHLGGAWWLMRENVASPEPPPPQELLSQHDEAEPPPAEPDATDTEPSPSTQASPAAPPSEPMPSDTPPDPPVAATRPLPPRDAPLAQVRDQLEARARAGDRRAACRLALDSAMCQQHAADPEGAAFFERNAARETHTDDATIDFIARLQRSDEHAAAVCNGLAPEWAAEHAWRHMMDAAQHDARLAARFAAFPPLDDALADAQPEAWASYRATAPGLLLRAAEEGDPSALWLLQRIYSGQTMPHGIGDAIAPDARLALVYALVLQRFTDARTRDGLQAQIDAERGALAPDAWRAIEAEAAALHARRFATQAPVDFSAGAFEDQDSDICELPAP